MLQVTELCEKAVKGDATMMSFANGTEQYFFGADIIRKSVITIITN